MQWVIGVGAVIVLAVFGFFLVAYLYAREEGRIARAQRTKQ